MNKNINNIMASEPYTPENMPKRWRCIDKNGQPGLNQATFRDKKTDLVVDSSIITLESGKKFIGITVTAPQRSLDLSDIWTVKNRFIGKDKAAGMLMPAYQNWDDIPLNQAIILYQLED